MPKNLNTVESFIQDLKNRKIVETITDSEKLKEVIKKKAAVYCGFDSTYHTAHVGHLVQLKLLKLLQSQGCPIIVLIGEVTARIGDPSFLQANRCSISKNQSKENCLALIKQIHQLLPGAKIVNNLDWYKELKILDFFLEIGKKFTIKKLIERKNVRTSYLADNLTYTQLSYILLQAYDFYNLWKNEKCLIQIGGKDQLPNIVFGFDLIRKLSEKEHSCVGITTPLLLTKSGQKISKSSGNINVFLSKKETSPFDFYQFILTLSDDVAKQWIKIFCDNYQEIFKKENSQKRIYQVFLAQSIFSWIYDKKVWTDFECVIKILNRSHLFDSTRCSFSKFDWKKLSCFLKILKPLSAEEDLGHFLVRNQVVPTLTKARTLINQNSIKIRSQFNQTKIPSVNKLLVQEKDPYILLRIGKQRYYLIAKS